MILKKEAYSLSLDNHDIILDSVINSTPDLIFYKDYLNQNGKYIGCNDAFASFVGKSKESIIGDTDIELFGEEIGGFFRTEDKEILEKGTAIISEKWLTYPNGDKVLLNTSKTPLKDKYNNVIGVFGISRDITQNYLISQALKEKNSELIKSKKKLDEVFEASGEGIWDWNIKTNHVEHNNKWYEILGLNKDKDLIENFTTLIHPEDKKLVIKKIEDALSGSSKSYHSEHRLFQKNGEIVWVMDKGRIVERDDEGNPLRMAGSFSVITDRKKIEVKLEEQHRYLQSIINGVNDSIMVIKEDYTVELMNETLKKSLTNMKISDPENPKCYEISHYRSTPCDGLDHPCPLRAVLETKKHTTVIHNHKTIDGNDRYVELSANPLLDKDNNCIGIIESSRDITGHLSVQEELREQKDILNHQAHHDALTGLANRILFNDRLEQAIQTAKRNKMSLALLFIDLDHFKEINDSLGHDVGDEILKTVSYRLVEAVRKEDSVARLGGDEFTVILEELSQAQDSSLIAKKILDVLAKPINVNDNILYVSSSIGISIYPDDGQSSQNLLKYADSAMYKAKDEGRNNYQYYNSTMTKLALKRVVMETGLRKAIENEEFIVYYQPQVDAITNTLIGMEALVRWQHPTLGIVFPDNFIPLAETTGLIVALDRLVMKKAMTQVVKWYKDGFTPGVLAMNLAVKQLHEKDFIEMFKNLMKETECKAEWIALEVTEGQVMTNPDKAIKILTQISDLGIGLAIDDFGTGYSSLAYLKRLPIDKLKIDQAFVKDLPDDEEDAGITKAVIALAKSLNLKVIAEGVETKEQKDFIVENGCKNIQGYLYSKPVPSNEFETFLKNGFDILCNH